MVRSTYHLQSWEQCLFSPLTYITLRPVFSVGEVDEGHVRGADEEREEPDGENNQEGVAGRQPGGQGVDDAHVPQHNYFKPQQAITAPVME